MKDVMPLFHLKFSAIGLLILKFFFLNLSLRSVSGSLQPIISKI